MLRIKHVARLSQVDSSGLHLHRGSWSGSIPVVNTHDAEREMRLGGEISTVTLSQQGLLPVLHRELWAQVVQSCLGLQQKDKIFTSPLLGTRLWVESCPGAGAVVSDLAAVSFSGQSPERDSADIRRNGCLGPKAGDLTAHPTVRYSYYDLVECWGPGGFQQGQF